MHLIHIHSTCYICGLNVMQRTSKKYKNIWKCNGLSQVSARQQSSKEFFKKTKAIPLPLYHVYWTFWWKILRINRIAIYFACIYTIFVQKRARVYTQQTEHQSAHIPCHHVYNYFWCTNKRVKYSFSACVLTSFGTWHDLVFSSGQTCVFSPSYGTIYAAKVCCKTNDFHFSR